MIFRLKFTGLQILHLWITFLDAWVHRKGRMLPPEDFRSDAGRQRFLRGNLKFQEDLNRFFATYRHVCVQCGGACCHSDGWVPLREMDYLLYDLCSTVSPKSANHSYHFRKTLEGFLWLNPVFLVFRVLRKLRRHLDPGRDQSQIGSISDSSAPDSPPPQHCVMLGETGCVLPWGARPFTCVMFVCRDLLNQMPLTSYCQYLWLMARYFTHLTLSVQTRLADPKKAT